jgi:hypothetical protein
MKLRIKGNSIRLRLTQSEVARLHSHGSLEERCNFGEAALRYTLASNGELGATLDGPHITVTVPRAAVAAWAEGTEVGIYGRSGPLELAIEKDFRCAHTRTEDASDSYPNPAI